MVRDLLGLSSLPVPAKPDPLLRFIQQAQIAIYYGDPAKRPDIPNTSNQAQGS